MTAFLLQAFIYLLAAVVAVPIANRIGLGSVLGYLLAGIVIGPLLGLVGAETQDLQHFAEFGVVMMLFLIGLELDPELLWSMRARLIGLGGLQVCATVALAAGAALAFGLPWQTALAVGFIVSVSSTAIVLQTLDERGLTRTGGGNASFAVLLFQDIAIIAMLAIVPLLAIPELAAGGADGHAGQGGHAMSLVDGLPGWGVALVTLGSIAAVVLGGHYLSRPVFRFIAEARMREVFTAAALLLVIGVALLMNLVGLSAALGTFLAGVILANSEFRHELQSDIEPFKGLLLGLFFITVGAGIDFQLLFADFALIAGLTAAVMLVKGAVLFALARPFRLVGGDRWLFTLGLAQIGEFGFVLISFSVQNAAMTPALAAMLSLVVALSMMATPLLFILHDRVIVPRMAEQDEREADTIDERGSVIIAGHGRFGQIVNRLLIANGFRTVVIDHRASLIEGLRRMGLRTFYGDATRPDLLESAGLAEARVLVVAIDDRARALEMVRFVKREHPHVHVVARAEDRLHVYGLYAAGADDIIREVFDSSVRAGRSALEALGFHPFRAEKAVQAFDAFDKETLRKLAAVHDPKVNVFDNEDYVRMARERTALIASAMNEARSSYHERTERAWMPPPPPRDARHNEAEPQAGADAADADRSGESAVDAFVRRMDGEEETRDEDTRPGS